MNYSFQIERFKLLLFIDCSSGDSFDWGDSINSLLHRVQAGFYLHKRVSDPFPGTPHPFLFGWCICLLFFSLYLLIYEAALGLHCRSWAFSSCCGRELLSRRGACHCGGFPCCRARALDTQTSGVVAQGSAAPRLVGSSLTRD